MQISWTGDAFKTFSNVNAKEGYVFFYTVDETCDRHLPADSMQPLFCNYYYDGTKRFCHCSALFLPFC